MIEGHATEPVHGFVVVVLLISKLVKDAVYRPRGVCESEAFIVPSRSQIVSNRIASIMFRICGRISFTGSAKHISIWAVGACDRGTRKVPHHAFGRLAGC